MVCTFQNVVSWKVKLHERVSMQIAPRTTIAILTHVLRHPPAVQFHPTNGKMFDGAMFSKYYEEFLHYTTHFWAFCDAYVILIGPCQTGEMRRQYTSDKTRSIERDCDYRTYFFTLHSAAQGQSNDRIEWLRACSRGVDNRLGHMQAAL